MEPQPVANQPPVSPITPTSKPKSRGMLFMGGILILGLGFTIGLLFSKNLSPTSQISPTPISSATPVPSIDPTANWKTYISPNKLFSVSLPTNWELDETNGISINIGGYSLGQISIHTRSDKEYVEGIWKSVNCEAGESSNQLGCAADTNKEVKILDINNNTVYWKVNSNGSKHAYIPNSPSNKTVEIIFPPADQKMVDQILSTFKFVGQKDTSANANPTIDIPAPNSKITNPVKISGHIPRDWTWEANFLIEIQNQNHIPLSSTPVNVTFLNETDPIGSFSVSLNYFAAPETKNGYLIIKNDNASGLPENHKSFEIPVNF